MPNKELGIADPVYDALRIRSGQSIAPDLGGGSTGTGGIENKIYVWHADGSTIDTFDPDATGLGLAIAAAAAGDTIWLPSIDIALTAAITIPASVTLTGISHEAVLTFTGFSGTAVTLSSGSIIRTCSVSMTSNGTTAIGVSAEAADSVVDDVIVSAGGGSVTNIAIGTGISSIYSEVWFATGGTHDAVVWSSNFLDVYPTYHKIDVPAGFDVQHFGMAHDYSACYISGTIGGNYAIYKLTNMAAIRSAPATSPTWSSILKTGDVITATPGGSLTVLQGTWNPLFRTRMYGSILVTTFVSTTGKQVYAEYNGTSWTFVNPANNYFDTLYSATKGYLIRYGIIVAQVFNCLMLQDGTSEEILEVRPGATGGFLPWRNTTQDVLYWSNGVITGASTAVLKIRRWTVADPGSYVLTGTGFTGLGVAPDLCDIRGAWEATPVWAVDATDGQLYISSDGTTWASAGANAIGAVNKHHIVMNTSLAGTGVYVWMADGVAFGGSILKTSSDSFATAMVDHTGNFWVDIQTSDDFTLIDMWLGY